MSDLDALLAGIVDDPRHELRWLILADWLDDHDQPDRAELLRLHRMMIDTCCEPDQHPERAAWLARIVELIDRGVTPCVPQHTIELPGGVPLMAKFIPPGSFLMGGTEFHEEQPVHRVSLTTGFHLATHPVTQSQWRAVLGENPSHFRGDELPVENVSWEEAVSFCRELTAATDTTARLPTEAEWEYACRAGTTSRFHWGDAPDAERMSHLGGGSTTPVGRFPANPWGLWDCHGNVWEWCDDWCDEGFYRRAPAVNPRCAERVSARRVVRGGSWVNEPRFRRSAYRGRAEPDRRSEYVGVRVVFPLDCLEPAPVCAAPQ